LVDFLVNRSKELSGSVSKKSPELVGKAPREVDPSIDAEEAVPQLRRVVG
jgi:hypothetical protein